MNKHIFKANELWRENRVEEAMACYEKVSHCQHAPSEEKNMANYMLAYLNCLLARRMSQEQTFLGVDLRQPYHDHYIQAGQYLAQVTDEAFNADECGLPEIDLESMSFVEASYLYFIEMRKMYVASWFDRAKAVCQQYTTSLMQRVQHGARV